MDPALPSPPELHPCLGDLFYADRSNVMSVAATDYTTSCNSQAASQVPPRIFHDVARRTLFLAFVISGELQNTRPVRNPFGTFNAE
jgi:hypothetical protein